MLPLIDQLREFLAWLKEHTLPGFKEFSEDFYDPDVYAISYDLLVEYGQEMKKSVEYNAQPSFDRFKAKYIKLFDLVNKTMATQAFERAVGRYLEKGHNQLDSETYAIEELWQTHQMRYWLPAQARMSHQDGRKVFIVANKRHIPQDNLYVLTTELEHIKQSGLDPWEYVSTRKAE